MTNTAADAAPAARRSLLVPLLTIIVAILCATCAVLVIRFRQVSVNISSPSNVSQASKLTAQLSQSMVLPSEQPTLVTVLDRTKLGDANLVTEARNGDELLIFAHAKRVVLYRPAQRKVVDMFHITVPTPQLNTQ